MKKVFLIIICFALLVCGCEKLRPINIISKPFSAVLNIKYKDMKLEYKFKYNNQDCSFISLNKDKIDFIFNENELLTQSDEIKLETKIELLSYSPIVVIKSIFDDMKNKEIVCDHNGEFYFYNTYNFGETQIKFNNDGYPIYLKVDNLNLSAKFDKIEVIT